MDRFRTFGKTSCINNGISLRWNESDHISLPVLVSVDHIGCGLIPPSFLLYRPDDGWVHEDQSYRMFVALIEENDLWPLFQAHGFTQRDMVFIKELIHPPKPRGDEYPFKGRDPGENVDRTVMNH